MLIVLCASCLTQTDKTLIKREAIPTGIQPSLGRKRHVTGVTSSSVIDKEIVIENMILAEFSPTRNVSGPITCLVMENNASQYDLIIGMDLMQLLGIDIHTSTKTVVWDGLRIPFKPRDYFRSEAYSQTMLDTMEGSFDDPDDTDNLGYKSPQIKSSLYEQHDTAKVAEQQVHLSPLQRQELAKLLAKFPKLFTGKLGCYKRKKVHLELKDGATPFWCRPHPVPKHHQRVFKEELDRLVEIGVLSPTGPAEWLTPSFIIPKKDGRVRWISDFRGLNKFIKRKVYNLPKIQDILQRRPGYEFFSKLDISMQYCTFELDEASKDLCTICTPFGNYRYNRLPMGVSQSPDIAQEIMEDLFRKFEEVDVYLDDLGVFSNSWQSHCTSLEKILAVLEENNFTVNPLKCEWGV